MRVGTGGGGIVRIRGARGGGVKTIFISSRVNVVEKAS